MSNFSVVNLKFTDSQSAIQAIAQMQHHKQPIVTDKLTTANKLHNQNDVETSIQWIPGHCDIPGNDRADKLARQGTSKTQHDEQVSYATSKQIIQTKSRKIWHDRWARGNTGRTYYQHQQTPNQTNPVGAPCTAERTPTSHQERTPSKVCLATAPIAMIPLNISCSTAHCTTTSDPDYCQPNQIYTIRYMDPLHNCNEQSPTTCQPLNRRDKIVRRLGDQER